MDRLELEHANLRAAINWSDAAASPDLALGIVAAVWRFWQKRGYLREARTRVEALVARPWFADAPAELRARTYEVLGGIVYWHGDLEAARPPYEAALAGWRDIGDPAEVAIALYNLSFCFSMVVVNDEAGRVRADALLAEALDLYRALGDDRGMANVQGGIGIQRYFGNDNAAAAEAMEASLQLYRKVGDRTQEAWALKQLGSARLKLGQTDAARLLLRDGLRLFDAAGDVAGVTMLLDDLSAVAVADGDLPRAARLQGLARRIQATSGTGLAGFVQDAFEDATRPTARKRLDPADLARYRDEGAAMPLPDGVRYALDEPVPA
jgi:tetratricopeptide (TPR) repeat protein